MPVQALIRLRFTKNDFLLTINLFLLILCNKVYLPSNVSILFEDRYEIESMILAI